jgi:hypothetical protein
MCFYIGLIAVCESHKVPVGLDLFLNAAFCRLAKALSNFRVEPGRPSNSQQSTSGEPQSTFAMLVSTEQLALFESQLPPSALNNSESASTAMRSTSRDMGYKPTSETWEWCELTPCDAKAKGRLRALPGEWQRSSLLQYAFPDDLRIADHSDRMPSVTLLLVDGRCYISLGRSEITARPRFRREIHNSGRRSTHVP